MVEPLYSQNNSPPSVDSVVKMEAANVGCLSPKTVFIDGTHIKAGTNTKKQVKAAIPVASQRYAQEQRCTPLATPTALFRKPWSHREMPLAASRLTMSATRRLYTRSRDCVKMVQRHIWEDYEEMADDIPLYAGIPQPL